MRAILFFIAVFIFTTTFAQAPSWLWAKGYGGSSYEFGNSIATGPGGEVYVAGDFRSPSIAFGSFTVTNSTANSDEAFLVKYDGAGNALWTTSFGGSGDDYATSVTVDRAGNVYLLGGFMSRTLQIGTTVLTNTDTSGATPDVFMVKYNAAGVQQWAKSFGGKDWEIPQCVAVDSTGNGIYIGGGFQSDSVFFGADTMITQGMVDAMLCKYDSSGNEKWARSAGGNLNDLANGVGTDAAGNVYLPGGFASATTTFGAHTLTNVGPNFPDIFFVKYDPAGNVIWATREGGPDNDHAVSVSGVVNGMIYITGHYHSTTFTADTSVLVNNGMGDVFVMKYDTSGNLQWAKSYGGNEHDFAFSVSTDAAGNAYVTGMFMSDSIRFDSYSFTNPMPGMQDLFVLKFDPAANVTWAIGGGGMGDDWVNGAALDAFGNIYVTGSYSSTSFSLGMFNLANADSSGNTYDVLVGKLGIPTAVSESSGMQTLRVYPNPSAGNAFINLPASPGNYELRLYDATGKCIWAQENIAPGKAEIDLPAAGIYFVEVLSENKIAGRATLVRE